MRLQKARTMRAGEWLPCVSFIAQPRHGTGTVFVAGQPNLRRNIRLGNVVHDVQFAIRYAGRQTRDATPAAMALS